MTVNLYALIEARPGHQNFGNPFYIGIGTADRPYKHLAQSRAKSGHRNLRLHEVLVSHRALGIAPGVSVLGVFADKASAGEAEKDAIKRYGREALDEGGILCNLAVGGQGPDSSIMRLPEIRKRIGDSYNRRSPESKAASLVALMTARNDPEAMARGRVKQAATVRAQWADPEIKAKRSAALRGIKKTPSPAALEARRANAKKSNTPEANAKKGAATRKRFEDPAERAKAGAQSKARWEDEEQKAAMLAGRSEGIAKSWEDPDVRARRIAGIKAAMTKPSSDGESEH